MRKIERVQALKVFVENDPILHHLVSVEAWGLAARRSNHLCRELEKHDAVDLSLGWLERQRNANDRMIKAAWQTLSQNGFSQGKLHEQRVFEDVSVAWNRVNPGKMD